MPKMRLSRIRIYDIKDLLNEVKRPKRLDFLLSRKRHKDDVECLSVRKMNHEDAHCRSLSLKPGCSLQPTLEQLLRDKESLSSFRRFLRSEFSEENLDFWLACEDFRTINSEQELRSKAHDIYQEFLETTSKREVNVDQSIREQILRSLDKPSATCFAEAQRHIFVLMKKDSLPRFIHSSKHHSLSNKSRTQWYI